MVETMTRAFPFILILAASLLPPPAHAAGATIEARVSRNPVTMDETFRLTFEAEGDLDGDPDFSPLEKDFDILQRSQSQNIQMINGRYSRTTRWTLSLMAKAPGKLEIPPISFGGDRSNGISIQVWESARPQAADTGRDLFLEVSVEPETAYVGQQLIYRVRLYRAVNITDPSLTPPKFNDPDALVEQLGEEQAFEARRHGRNYLVSQIDYAVFPQTSGTLTLEPMVFQARILRQAHGGGRFGSPFDMLERAGPVKRVRSKPLSIEVLPIPKDAPRPWLPASSLQLSASWPESQPRFRVGEPVTRTLILVADGLMSAQLPRIAPAIPAGFKQYPDQPLLEDREDNGIITGIRQEKIALVPTEPGLHTLPAVEIAWWNTATNRREVARVPEQRIQVLPAAGSAPEPPPEPSPAKRETKSLERPPTPAGTGMPGRAEAGEGFFRWLSLFLALGWVATALAWWRLGGRRKPGRTTAGNTAPAEKGRKQCLAELKRACIANDAEAARSALAAWGATQWPAAPPRGLTDMAARLDGEAARQASILEQALYGRDGGGWEGAALWEAIRHVQPPRTPRESTGDALAPLYPS